MSTNIPKFNELGALPIGLNLERFNNGIEETLREKNAKYHNKCQLLFKNSTLAKVKKQALVAIKLKNVVVELKESLWNKRKKCALFVKKKTVINTYVELKR